MEKLVGIVGIGIMGGAFMRNLRKSGFRVIGYDRAAGPCRALAEAGGELAASPRDVAEKTAVIITSLPSVDAFHDVVSGKGGIAGAVGSGQIVIECSTLPVEVKQAGHDALAATGKILLDCPVSGTGAQAARKDLVIFASGDRDACKRCEEVFAGMSRQQRYLGPFGTGSKMKFIANHLVTIHNLAAAEAIVLGIKTGLDPQLVYDTIEDSAGTSRMFQVRGGMMVRADYDTPTATIKMHMKDIDIIAKFAANLQCPMPLFAAAAQYYHAGMGQGRGGQDTAAVCAVLEEMAGMDPKRAAR